MSRRWGGATAPCGRSCLCGVLAPAIHRAWFTDRAARLFWVFGCCVMRLVAKGGAHASLGTQTGMAIIVMTIKSRLSHPSLGWASEADSTAQVCRAVMATSCSGSDESHLTKEDASLPQCLKFRGIWPSRSSLRSAERAWPGSQESGFWPGPSLPRTWLHPRFMSCVGTGAGAGPDKELSTGMVWRWPGSVW